MALQEQEIAVRNNEGKPILLDDFLRTEIYGYDPESFETSLLLEGLNRVRDKLDEEDSDLYGKARDVLAGIDRLLHLRREVQGLPSVRHEDAVLVQSWVKERIDSLQMRIMARAIFPDWQDRLEEASKKVPHIAQANEWMAGRIAAHFQDRGGEKIFYADLGIGTGGTYNAVEAALLETGVEVSGVGIDITWELIHRAQAKTSLGLEDFSVGPIDMLAYLRGMPQKAFDVITCGYALHHLPADDQVALIAEAFRTLKDGGVLAISDPTGMSDFNLKVLLPNEPEGIFAHFVPSPEERVLEFMDAGFIVSIDGESLRELPILNDEGGTIAIAKEKGDVLDQGLLGYALVGVRPPRDQE